MSSEARFNVARRLRQNAERFPDKKALVYPERAKQKPGAAYFEKTYLEIDRESDAYARGFQKLGIGRGTKTILMVKPSPELFTIVFGLFKVGAVPVIVDPGLGVSRMLHCYATVGAEAFVGIPIANAVRAVFPQSFAELKAKVTVGKRALFGGVTLDAIAEHRDEPFPIVDVERDDLLVLNFTTGSTGPARGVEYTHQMLDAMADRIAALYEQSDDDVSLATVPIMALFDMLLGSKAVLPPMDPTKPAKANPDVILDAVDRLGVTRMFASPAFLHRVGTHAQASGRTLTSMRTVVAGGAPVTVAIVQCFRAVIPASARLFTTYGATEALPIASIESRDVLSETSVRTGEGDGTCVGTPTEGVEIRIARITDKPIERWTPDVSVRPGEVGEIVIAGAIVSPRYHRNPEWNALAKIQDGERTWHRTGDLGSLDEQGRLWFCGRKSHRVQTARGPRFTVQWEGVFNKHPDVYRTALVGVGEKPVVCVELREKHDAAGKQRIENELRAMAEESPRTREATTFLFHDAFPVDIRHNAKIGREELAIWAARRLGKPASESEMRTRLMIVPIAGWAFIVLGLLFPLSGLLRALWLIDVFLSVIVHGLQLFVSLPRGKRAGYHSPYIVIMTFLFGATWWKPLR